jgi:DNA-binding transcriptional MocR family regulator
MSLERRREIAAIAEAHEVAVLEDDVNGFLPETPIAPIAALAPAQTYYLTGTSKSLAPGLRVGYVVPPPGKLERIAATIRATTWLTAPLLSEVVSQWIESGAADVMAGWKRREITARYTLACSILGPWLAQPSPPVSFHLWLSLPEPWRSETFVAQARSRGVAVNSSQEFMVGRESAPHAVRVCLGGTVDRDRLTRGLEILAELLRSSPEPSLNVY